MKRTVEKYYKNVIARKNLGFVIRNRFPHSYLEHRKLSFEVHTVKALGPQIEDAPILSKYCGIVYDSLKSDLQGRGERFRGIEKLEPFRPDEIEVEPFPLIFYCRDCNRLYKNVESLPSSGICKCSVGVEGAKIYQISQMFICPNCGEINTVWDAFRKCKCSPEHIHYKISDPLHPYKSAEMWCDIHQWREKVRENVFCSICRRPLEAFPVSSSYLNPAREVFIEGGFEPSAHVPPIEEDLVGEYGIESVEFGSLNTVELVYGYRVDVPAPGPPRQLPVRPFMHPTEDNKALALSKILKTKALKIRFMDVVMENLKDRDYIFLHTFKHLMLWASPNFTGLEVGEIMGVVSTADGGVVYLYDNQPGGIGGCEALSDPNRFLGLLDYAKRFIRDHTNCVDACKKCLYLPHGVCKDLNRNLNRNLLLEHVYHAPAGQITPWEDVRIS